MKRHLYLLAAVAFAIPWWGGPRSRPGVDGAQAVYYGSYDNGIHFYPSSFRTTCSISLTERPIRTARMRVCRDS